LEIGVFKGNVISLWALVGKQIGISVTVCGISPFEGSTRIQSPTWHRIRKIIDPFYKSQAKRGNLYLRENYIQIIRQVFDAFELDIASVELIRGYSTDQSVIERIKDREFDVIYIDGDHSFAGTKHDIVTYTSHLALKGFLVMDDASFFLPGNFFKGYEAVAQACERLPHLGFHNVLNVGHNRVYVRNNY